MQTREMEGEGGSIKR